MREVDPSGDAKSGANASGGPSPSVPPPASSRSGFIGTNVNTAQAYVPPTALPETPEPPAPEHKVALSDHVDPRKLPTYPNLKKVAQGLSERPSQSGASERPPPIIEAPPDSQASGIRRGAGYAPARGNPPPSSAVPRVEPAPHAAPAKAVSAPSAAPAKAAAAAPRPAPAKGAVAPRTAPAKGAAAPRAASGKPVAKGARPHPSDVPETPAQRSAALLLIFVFAALLAVGVYFLMRRAPSPYGEEASPSTTTAPLPSEPTAGTSQPAAVPSTAAAPEPSADPTASVSATTRSSSVPARSSASAAPSEAVGGTTAAPQSGAPSASSGATAAPSTSAPPKSDRWF